MNNLLIIEKYEEFINYVYPVVQNIQRKHGYVKQKFIDLVFHQVDLFYKALKSNQKSKLYEADGNLAAIRFYLRFLANKERKLITKKQQQVCEVKLAEVGSILNSWIKKYKQQNNEDQLEKFLGSWTGHIATADSANLKNYIKKEYELWNNRQLA